MGAALANPRLDAVLEPSHQAITTGAGWHSWERPLLEIAHPGGPVILAENTRKSEKPHVLTKNGAKPGVVENWTDPFPGVSLLPVTWTLT